MWKTAAEADQPALFLARGIPGIAPALHHYPYSTDTRVMKTSQSDQGALFLARGSSSIVPALGVLNPNPGTPTPIR
jgi:hypothetical protein